MTLELKERRLKFIHELKKYSEDKDEPVCEWECTGLVRELDSEERKEKKLCICSTPIVVLYTIKNKKNNIELEIGSECIKRWLNPSLKCSGCDIPLGNITQRLRKKDKLCRSCKKENKFYEEQYGMYTINNVPFSKITDIDEIERIINKERKTITEELFEIYIKQFYTIKEVAI